MIKNRRRVFDLRHQKEMAVAQKQSDRAWDSTIRYRDWRSKKAMKAIEPHRVQKDAHVLETVISERNEYFMDTLRQVTREVPTGQISHTRTLPPEICAVAKAKKRTFYWC
jgi:glycyl-tRNA synthetase (class II)